mgnify:CR=1 FL=1
MTYLVAGMLFLFLSNALCLGALWWVTTEVKAMQKSTHSIQYVPADSGFQKVTEEVREALNKDIFENLQ